MATRIIIILIALSPIISLLVYKYVRDEPLFRADIKSLLAVLVALVILFAGLVTLRVNEDEPANKTYKPAEVGEDGRLQQGGFQ
ncbi:MAG TPA: hypothetical protein DHV03_05440 [Alphaproteobacteria bacterium]|mgnify:FL=1|jgi:hypothetical protein|nr:hypothetical protein [Paracoccaceae bacterium]RCL79574.1 MAG: hypothetical protein DBW67_05435 [SAR116 cluster bacterium]RPH14573.1 MAG: hypothetical protein CBD10_001760 [Alphaproteobacteria bacterium TMED150]HBQ23382.1 hypothetical protein [Alphaproteobacteria bacterium]HCY48109.1 hypothetical protein [Alphaproteobacteria bacterium]|tara:strand:- start:3027 stop:3278 length:252 start_codon:yes stop_codon:yes gene_type:complete